MYQRINKQTTTAISVVLCFFTIVAVNYNILQPQSALAVFVMLGMVLCFLNFPALPQFQRPEDELKDTDPTQWQRQYKWWVADRVVGVALALATVVCFVYIFVHTEPITYFKDNLWPEGVSLGNRAGSETQLDFVIGIVGVIIVLEGTRRSIGWIVPALSAFFLVHAYFAPGMPDWLLPHRGLDVTQIVSSTFLQSLGVLGPAAGVMFKYVFLFVLFGAFLEMSGATRFIIDFSESVFGKLNGGPAMVSVVGSGLMGSLSGSAVANAVTTGSFTIPMMRNAGFRPHVAGGITAAAASGGALVPPVMGAGAYMMLEFIERAPGQPQVTFLEIAKAALIPALLYYFSLLAIVYFFARATPTTSIVKDEPRKALWQFESIVFFGALGSLVGMLLLGFSPFKAVTGSLVLILLLSTMRPQLQLRPQARVLALVCFAAIVLAHQLTGRIEGDGGFWSSFLAPSWYSPTTAEISGRFAFDSLLSSAFIGLLGLLVFGLIHPEWRPEITKSMTRSAQGGISLVAASACVGIIIGIVQTTPMANDFGAEIKAVVEQSLLLALIGIMLCSIVLGMGVPSVVCYLLMATLMGSLLGEMGVDPLAAHLFIFYFGMMSMVTPPVALAAYASASIAEAPIMKTALAAFRFSLVGFTLPFMFVYRPALLLMGPEGQVLTWGDVPRVLLAVGMAVFGIISLAAAIAGCLRAPLSLVYRGLLVLAAALLLLPVIQVGEHNIGIFVNVAGGVLFFVVFMLNRGTPISRAPTPQIQG